MDSKYLGTKDILFSIINKGEAETANYAIAMYLLEHYGDIKNINILDMAEECFVDRSTIRRFFVKYGFDSFKEFKEHYENSFEERYFKEIPFQTYGDYINSLNSKLFDFISQFTLKRDKTKDIEEVIDRIYKSNHLVLLGDETFYGNMYFVQQSMLAMNKIVFLITNKIADNPVLEKLDADDCMIVYSLSGEYYSAIKEQIKDVPCQKMMFTLHKKEQWAEDFDYIAQLTRDPEKADADVYRKYAFTYFTDLMITTYKMKYQRK